MSTGTAPICYLCVHFHGAKPKVGWVCDAFPNGIPQDILISRRDHHFPYDGDQCIQFSDIEDGNGC